MHTAPMVRGVGLTEEKEEERTEDRVANGGGSWVGGEYANVIDITF